MLITSWYVKFFLLSFLKWLKFDEDGKTFEMIRLFPICSFTPLPIRQKTYYTFTNLVKIPKRMLPLDGKSFFQFYPFTNSRNFWLPLYKFGNICVTPFKYPWISLDGKLCYELNRVYPILWFQANIFLLPNIKKYVVCTTSYTPLPFAYFCLCILLKFSSTRSYSWSDASKYTCIHIGKFAVFESKREFQL